MDIIILGASACVTTILLCICFYREVARERMEHRQRIIDEAVELEMGGRRFNY